MLLRYQNGEKANNLADHYGCDHTTILFHVKRHGIYIGRRRSSNAVLGIPAPTNQIELSGFEKKNPGKTYSEYVAEDLGRRAKRFKCFAKASVFGVLKILPYREKVTKGFQVDISDFIDE